MFSDQGIRIVAASVTPVVVISASGLLCLAFYNRLAAIVSRLRAFQRERLQGLERASARPPAPPADHLAAQRRRRVQENLHDQTARLVRRARLIRLTLLCLLGTIATLIVSSILNGLSVVWAGAMVGAALLFLLGMTLMLIGIASAIFEMFVSLDVAEMERDFVSEMEMETDFVAGLNVEETAPPAPACVSEGPGAEHSTSTLG